MKGLRGKRFEERFGRSLEREDHQVGSVPLEPFDEQPASVLEFNFGDALRVRGGSLDNVGETDACSQSAAVLAELYGVRWQQACLA